MNCCHWFKREEEQESSGLCVGDSWVLGTEEWLVEGKKRFSGRLVSGGLCDAGVVWGAVVEHWWVGGDWTSVGWLHQCCWQLLQQPADTVCRSNNSNHTQCLLILLVSLVIIAILYQQYFYSIGSGIADTFIKGNGSGLLILFNHRSMFVLLLC